MSDWCENILRITAHSAEAIKQLKDFKEKSKTKEDVFDLAGTYPVIDGIEGGDYSKSPGICWGTNWMAYPKIQHDHESFFCVIFITRNAPPCHWLEKVTKDFPYLHFSLEWEVPFSCAGVLDILNGSCIEYDKDLSWFDDDEVYHLTLA